MLESESETFRNSGQLSLSGQQGINLLWKTVLSVCVTFLILQFSQSLLTALEKRAILDNGLNILSVICLAIAFVKYRKRQPTIKSRRSWLGLSLLVASSLVTAFGIYFYFARIAWLGFLAMAASLLLAIGGKQQLSYWRPLFFFSITLLPVGADGLFSHLSVLLKMASMAISAFMAGFFMNLETIGSIVSIDGVAVEVTAACSGLAILTSLIFISLLWQLFKPMKVVDLSVLLLLACLVAVVTNSVRLFLTFLTVHFHSLDLGLQIHSNIEILLLPISMLALFIVANKFKRYDANV